MSIDRDFWAQRRVLLTGHTGFKGAWLALWLQSLGARVAGLAPARAPTAPSLYELACVGGDVAEHRCDVRDGAAVRAVLRAERPEVVLHLAAQPMVRRSLAEPALTYEVNVLGTVNVLDAVRAAADHVRAVVVVTSDKCYENPTHRAPPAAQRPFVEGDALGGADPYSSSKACAELVAAAYRSSFFLSDDGPRVATARAGNVIGGGDWGEDRLMPDAVRAVYAGAPLRVRNPDAVRPWQHVLNPLAGYLLLAQELWRTPDAARGWNFGPRAADAQPVRWIVERLAANWNGALQWERDGDTNPPEAGYLSLDSSAAERELGWRPAWDLGAALDRVVEWHERHRGGEDVRRVTLAQIAAFADARQLVHPSV